MFVVINALVMPGWISVNLNELPLVKDLLKSSITDISCNGGEKEMHNSAYRTMARK
ncbi:hypothetical protein TanjilG_05731 [Lupinus angustifolius]|uniref:Uncharacterized protein n=1 Tax=Lupinus angustifolius TaxID=3871 RepID=A0A4P1R3F6_LUPAN|nr:hypothetical protein TanjilG_05731 [Lupinus angustifolius]